MVVRSVEVVVGLVGAGLMRRRLLVLGLAPGGEKVAQADLEVQSAVVEISCEMRARVSWAGRRRGVSKGMVKGTTKEYEPASLSMSSSSASCLSMEMALSLGWIRETDEVD